MTIGGTGQTFSGLGGASGYGELEVPRGDDVSFMVDVSAVFRDGLQLFGQNHDGTIFINTNGTISLGEAFDAYPTLNPAFSSPFIAPFWGDVDTRLDGEGLESGGIWADLDTGLGILSVTWAGVGVYRRNADLSNLFQVQIHDQGGGDFDIAFRYERIEWVQGTASDDTGAEIGFFGSAGSVFSFGSSDLNNLASTAGNGGAEGLWVYSVVDGQIRDYYSKNAPIFGSDDAEDLIGTAAADHLLGYDGQDQIIGGAGADTVDAGAGDDVVFGDLGNDSISGGLGNDSIQGGEGADQVYGDDGADTLTGSARSDVLMGGNSDDFLNGGWGHDTLTGGDGADRFYHEGVQGHGNDWVTDFNNAEGDVLIFGQPAEKEDFLVQYAQSPNRGADSIKEAFVTYVPTAQILWALQDGATLDQITLIADGVGFDLL